MELKRVSEFKRIPCSLNRRSHGFDRVVLPTCGFIATDGAACNLARMPWASISQGRGTRRGRNRRRSAHPVLRRERERPGHIQPAYAGRFPLVRSCGDLGVDAEVKASTGPALYRALSDNRQRARPRLRRFVRSHQRHGLSVAQQSRLGNLKSSRLRRELLLVLTGWTHRLAWTLAPPLGP
jgi:hypothetical protein